MISEEYEKTTRLSHLKRLYHLAEALYWRERGNRKLKRACLSSARCERLNQMYFLGDDMPF